MYTTPNSPGSTVPAPLDATALYGAGHLIGGDDLEAIFGTGASTDAPTAAPIAAQIERLHTILDRAAAQAAGLTTGHITDADTARDAQDRASEGEVEELRAREIKELRDLEAKYTDLLDKNAALREKFIALQREHSRVSSVAASLHEQRDSLWRQNVALLHGGQPVHEFDMGFHAEDAAFAVQRAQMLEAEGASTAPRWARDSRGRIIGLDVVHLAAVVDGARGEMAVTDGEMERAA